MTRGAREAERWPKSPARRPGRGPQRQLGRKPFGATWWGAAWVHALEHRASLDRNRLPRGRNYARSGQVEQIEVEAGLLRCLVQGSRDEPYAVRVRVRTFEADEWDRVLDALAAQAGHAAALLDGELLPEVADDLRQAGVDLLPGAGELQPRCTCPDWADPCKHSAAACYLLADELDRDPFAVFLLRGRSREELLAGLRARRKTRVGVETPRLPTKEPSDVTTPAARAWERTPEPLPSLPLVPRRPGQPTVLAVDPPAGSPISAAGLRMIAADAAAPARDLVAGERTVPFDERVEHDLARHAAGLLAGRANGQLTELGRRAGVAGRELLTLALAWQYGGTGAVSTLIEPWDPPSEQLQRGRLALGPGAVARRNRVTRRDRQLRLGRDGRWYPYAKAGGRWSPDGPPREIGPQGAAE